MKRVILLAALLTLATCLTAGFGVSAQRNKGIPVTSTIAGTGALPDPTISNYRVQSDLVGPYLNNVDSVTTELQTGGDWRLDALASPTRKMLFDFRDSVSGSNPSPPFLVGQAPGMIETKSYLLYGHGQVAGMTGLNTTLITPLVMRFDLNGNIYHVWMNSANYPQTNYALVKCVGVVSPTNSQCIHWTIEPSVTQPDGQLKNIAKLTRTYTSKGKTIEENHGDFYISFSIDITNP
jgi:hypothetical protein